MHDKQKTATISAKILYFILLFINVSGITAFFFLPESSNAGNDVAEQGDSIAAYLVESTGGLTEVTGIQVFILTLFMLGVGVALIRNTSWSITGALAVITTDIILKTLNLGLHLSNDAISPDVLLAFLILIIEVSAFLIFGWIWRLQRQSKSQRERTHNG